MAENSETKSTTCAHFLAGKKRKCRMLVKVGKRFCGEHASLDSQPDAEERMPCPYDSKQ